MIFKSQSQVCGYAVFHWDATRSALSILEEKTHMGNMCQEAAKLTDVLCGTSSGAVRSPSCPPYSSSRDAGRHASKSVCPRSYK